MFSSVKGVFGLPITPPITPPTTHKPIISTSKVALAYVNTSFTQVVTNYDAGNDFFKVYALNLPKGLTYTCNTKTPTRTCLLSGKPSIKGVYTISFIAQDKQKNATIAKTLLIVK
jgi:hypothetical protein